MYRFIIRTRNFKSLTFIRFTHHFLSPTTTFPVIFQYTNVQQSFAQIVRNKSLRKKPQSGKVNYDLSKGLF